MKDVSKPDLTTEYGDDIEYCEVVDIPVEKAAVPSYSEEEHGTWEILLATQHQYISGRACKEFIKGLEAVNFPPKRIPRLRDVSAVLKEHTGWQLLRVDGLVHPVAFFELLARKIFPSTDFIRKRSELKYTPEPDMFHDLFGHAPLLTDPDFTEFFEAFGHIGVAASKKYPPDHEIHRMLPRIYWFTVEFGLINTPQGLRAYGSGSVSSPEELQYCVSDKPLPGCKSPVVKRHPFDIKKVAQKHYDIWHLQEEVFVIDSFEQLGREFRAWAASYGLSFS